MGATASMGFEITLNCTPSSKHVSCDWRICAQQRLAEYTHRRSVDRDSKI